jgi:hypothetical protein
VRSLNATSLPESEGDPARPMDLRRIGRVHQGPRRQWLYQLFACETWTAKRWSRHRWEEEFFDQRPVPSEFQNRQIFDADFERSRLDKSGSSLRDRKAFRIRSSIKASPLTPAGRSPLPVSVSKSRCFRGVRDAQNSGHESGARPLRSGLKRDARRRIAHGPGSGPC